MIFGVVHRIHGRIDHLHLGSLGPGSCQAGIGARYPHQIAEGRMELKDNQFDQAAKQLEKAEQLASFISGPSQGDSTSIPGMARMMA